MHSLLRRIPVHGTVTCRRARRLSRRVLGDNCFGDKIAGGFMLRRGRNVIEGRVRSA